MTEKLIVIAASVCLYFVIAFILSRQRRMQAEIVRLKKEANEHSRVFIAFANKVADHIDNHVAQSILDDNEIDKIRAEIDATSDEDIDQAMRRASQHAFEMLRLSYRGWDVDMHVTLSGPKGENLEFKKRQNRA